MIMTIATKRFRDFLVLLSVTLFLPMAPAVAEDTTMIEVVTWRAVEGTSDTKMREHALAMTPILKTMPGFIDRSLGKTDDGVWVDVLRWRSRADFENAGEKIIALPEAAAFFELMQNETIKSHYAKQQGQKTD